MPDTVSIICAEGKPLSVEAERKQHSDWVKQEAQHLMDELFFDIDHAIDPDFDDESSAAVDVDWVDGLMVNSSPQLSQTWVSLNPEQDDDEWIAKSETTSFYKRFLLVLGGLAVITPLSFWGATMLQASSKPRSVIAATPIQTNVATQSSDHEFAQYAEQALRQIKVQPKQPESQSVGITALPTLKIGDRVSAIPPALPTVPSSLQASINGAASSSSPAPEIAKASPEAVESEQPNASPADMERLALRVFQPKQPIQSEVPSVSSENSQLETAVSSAGTLPAPPSLSSISPAPNSELPTLAANISEPTNVIAAATPMSSPESASKKVIGIVELGLQSTLMVSNNGSHLNFQVGDIVNDDGWKLVQIAQGKAILQKGAEYKTLSEGQYF